jgi:hypothetical protein
MATPRYPALNQINTQIWLQELGASLGRSATLEQVPDESLDAIAADGFNWVWLLGVWQTGEAGRQVSLRQPEWQPEYHELLPDVLVSCGSICLEFGSIQPPSPARHQEKCTLARWPARSHARRHGRMRYARPKPRRRSRLCLSRARERGAMSPPPLARLLAQRGRHRDSNTGVESRWAYRNRNRLGIQLEARITCAETLDIPSIVGHGTPAVW